MKDDRERRVVALVLSHNAPQSLARCLNAIAAQTNPPQGVVVVDNASDPPITPTLIDRLRRRDRAK